MAASSGDGADQSAAVTSDGALLSLIVDDTKALLVLAAWGGLGCKLIDINDNATIQNIADVSGLSTVSIAPKLQKLLIARVLVDGGISEMADKMLQTQVQGKLGGKRK
jgi:hypothetical protein